MEDGVHHFERVFPGGLLYPYRDSSAIVLYGYGSVLMNGDLDPIAHPRQRLVNRVIHYLKYEMVQAALVGAADIHAGASTHGLQALEHLNVVRCIADRPVSHGWLPPSPDERASASL